MNHRLFPIRSFELTYKHTLIFILFGSLLSSVNSYSHDTGARVVDGIITGRPVHQHITKEAGNTWTDLPSEIAFHLAMPINAPLDPSCFANYDSGYDDIVTGSADEDQEWAPGCPTLGPYNRGYLEHFWDPDQPNISSSGTYEYGAYDYGYEGDIIVLGLTGVLQFSSAYRKAQELWDKKTICHYTGRDKYGNTCPVDKDRAYYWLGRIVHLLEDMSVPAHVHNVPHNWASDIYLWTSSDPFEEYVGDVFPVFLGNRYKELGPYKYEDLPSISLQQDFTDANNWWHELHPNPTNLFKLFWYTAQKTQYYASGGTVVARSGDSGYTKLSGKYVGFKPSLWVTEGVAPVMEPIDVPAKLQEMARALVPHALRAVAGLYRLFWLETNIAQQAQQDMINRAKLDPRFGAAIPGTFHEQLDWVTNMWDLRWMNFNFSGGRVVTIYHATYKPEPAYRYTIYWDPDTNNWINIYGQGWVQAQ